VSRDGVGEVVLGGGVLVAGDDEAVLIYEAGFPVVAADDVGDVIISWFSIAVNRAIWINFDSQ